MAIRKNCILPVMKGFPKWDVDIIYKWNDVFDELTSYVNGEPETGWMKEEARAALFFGRTCNPLVR